MVDMVYMYWLHLGYIMRVKTVFRNSGNLTTTSMHTHVTPTCNSS